MNIISLGYDVVVLLRTSWNVVYASVNNRKLNWQKKLTKLSCCRQTWHRWKRYLLLMFIILKYFTVIMRVTIIGATTVGTGRDLSPTFRLGDQQFIVPPASWP